MKEMMEHLADQTKWQPHTSLVGIIIACQFSALQINSTKLYRGFSSAMLIHFELHLFTFTMTIKGGLDQTLWFYDCSISHAYLWLVVFGASTNFKRSRSISFLGRWSVELSDWFPHLSWLQDLFFNCCLLSDPLSSKHFWPGTRVRLVLKLNPRSSPVHQTLNCPVPKAS